MSGNDSPRFIPALLSLQESAINTIVTNIAGYRDLIQKKISPPMRKLVFERAMERIEEIGADQVWAALPYLDQHRTTERFSTEDFASIFRLKGETGEISKGFVSMEEFLQYLVEFVPNLQQLEIHDPRMSILERKMFGKVRMEPVATDLLLKLENLTDLSINGVCIKFTGFVSVIHKFQNLQSILADNILVDLPKNSMKTTLEAIGSMFDCQLYFDFEFSKKVKITLKKTNAFTPHRVAFVSEGFLDLIPSRLTELYFHSEKTADTQSERDCFLRNLQRVGGSLKRLTLNSVGPELNITLKLIFKHCPELESLCIYNSCVTADEPIASFGKLTHFSWHDDNSACTARLDRIFSAPLLQEVTIIGCKLDLGDKELLFNQIRNHSILTQLTNIRILYLTDRAKRNLNVKDFHDLSDVLQFRGVERVDVRIESITIINLIGK